MVSQLSIDTFPITSKYSLSKKNLMILIDRNLWLLSIIYWWHTKIFSVKWQENIMQVPPALKTLTNPDLMLDVCLLLHPWVAYLRIHLRSTIDSPVPLLLLMSLMPDPHPVDESVFNPMYLWLAGPGYPMGSCIWKWVYINVCNKWITEKDLTCMFHSYYYSIDMLEYI